MDRADTEGRRLPPGWEPGGGQHPRRAGAGALSDPQGTRQRGLVAAASGRDCSAWPFLRHHTRDITQAEIYYQQALALADELGMRPLQAHCHHGLGRLYCQTGRREPARAELSTAMARYRAMDMTFWLPQAEATLAQVGSAREERC